MSYREVREVDIADYQNADLVNGFEALDEIAKQRSGVAIKAAEHIIDMCDGETLDLRLYYAAMFGRSYSEGMYEHDPNLLVPLGIVRMLADSHQEGQPLLIRAVNYPESNVDVGVVASFSDDSFEPVRFRVSNVDEIDSSNGFRSWEGGLDLAMYKVLPVGEADYKLSDEVSTMTVCETATWTTNNGILEIHASGTGGVEVGEKVHLNSEHSHNYHNMLAFWLRQHLAPTEPKPMTYRFKDMQSSMRQQRNESARQQGVSEAIVASQGLSHTIEAFFETLEPYTLGEELAPIDIKTVFESWHDPYDAQNLLAEVQVRDLVELGEDGLMYVSALGLGVFENWESPKSTQ